MSRLRLAAVGEDPNLQLIVRGERALPAARRAGRWSRSPATRARCSGLTRRRGEALPVDVVAGGVVFTVDNAGNLLAWDEASGLPLLRRPGQADDGELAVGLSSSGVAIASGMVIGLT